MKFLQGSKEEFFNFIDSISKKDKIGILTHNDLDGIASAIFIEEILRIKTLNLDFINFLSYEEGMFDRQILGLKDKKIAKLFLTDLNENADIIGFEKLSKGVGCFLIDHHSGFVEGKKRINTESADCSAITIYSLGKGIIDYKKWNWLACSSIISEMSYKKKENLEFLQEIYPEVTMENIYESIPTEISKRITSACIYYCDDLRKVYDIVKRKDLNSIEKIHIEVNKLIEYLVNEYQANAEFYPEQNLYFYNFKKELRGKCGSIVSTKVSLKEPEKTFIVVSYQDGNIKISARNQSGNVDVKELMKKGVKGLDASVAGGHVRASGANIRKKDLSKFKENILRKN